LISSLSVKISQSNEILNGQEIGNALYGLQGMSSNEKAVLNLLSALSVKISQSKELLRAQEIGNALYGLQKMSSNENEVLGLISALTVKISQSKDILKAQEIGNALYGLQGMSSSKKEVLNLIAALSTKISQSQELLDTQNIGNALYGLQSMNSDQKEVLDLLSTLAVKISKSNELLDAQSIGNALYGLQGMSDDKKEVLDLLSVLYPKILESNSILSAQQLSNAIYGLQRMQCGHTESLILMFLKQLSLLEVSNLSLREVTSVYQSLALVSLLPSYACDKLILDSIEGLQQKFLRVLDNNFKFSTSSKFSSMAEKNFFQFALAACNNLSIPFSLTHNEILHGFEADIVLRVSVSPSSQMIINVELDGPRHKLPKTLRFCQLRDQYLSFKHKIQIARLDLLNPVVQRMTSDETIAWFSALIDKCSSNFQNKITSVDS